MPNPLASKSNAEFGSKGFAIACHEQSQEARLRDIFGKGVSLNEVDDVLGNNRAFSDSVDSSLWREALLGILLHCNAVTSCKYIGVAGRLQELIDSEITIQDV